MQNLRLQYFLPHFVFFFNKRNPRHCSGLPAMGVGCNYLSSSLPRKGYQLFYMYPLQGSRNEDSHFLVEKHKDKGYFTVQANKQRGMFVGFTPKGAVRPTVDTGTNNIHIFPEVVECESITHSLTHPGMSVWTLPPEPSV